MPESGVTKHNYLFCQFVNPARGHEGDRCDCFDTPSQRRTTLAKQRLARLRANREINRASTSNDPESAVASDPAVTLPADFHGDQAKGEDFLEECKGYLLLIEDVPGFDSPKKKIQFVLTHIKGPDVAGWVKDMQ